MTWYRIESADADHARLLDPSQQVSSVWGGAEYCTRPCRACGASGYVWERDAEDAEPCSQCDGEGAIPDGERAGISVCHSVQGLVTYFRGRAADLTDVVLIELEGECSEEDDWDAAYGAYLVFPTEIVSVAPLSAGIRLAIEAA